MKKTWYAELIGCIPDNYYNVYSEDGDLVADHIPTEEKANLIASAPELFSALKLYIKLDNDHHAGLRLSASDWYECYANAEKAMSKVQGER
jgi:hypothetical protein